MEGACAVVVSYFPTPNRLSVCVLPVKGVLCVKCIKLRVRLLVQYNAVGLKGPAQHWAAGVHDACMHIYYLGMREHA